MKTPAVVKVIVGNEVEPKWNATTMSFEYANNAIKTLHALVNVVSKQAQFRDYGKITNQHIIVRFQQQPPDFSNKSPQVCPTVISLCTPRVSPSLLATLHS